MPAPVANSLVGSVRASAVRINQPEPTLRIVRNIIVAFSLSLLLTHCGANQPPIVNTSSAREFATPPFYRIAGDGSTIVMNGDWTYRLEFEAYEDGAFRITEGINGGEGNDRIAVNGRINGRTRWPSFTGALPGIDAGGGDDSIAITNQTIRSVYGGAGNDAITARAKLISHIEGGAGNDAIAAYAEAIMHIGGGTVPIRSP